LLRFFRNTTTKISRTAMVESNATIIISNQSKPSKTDAPAIGWLGVDIGFWVGEVDVFGLEVAVGAVVWLGVGEAIRFDMSSGTVGACEFGSVKKGVKLTFGKL